MLGKHQTEVLTLVYESIIEGLFPTGPKRVPACLDGELSLILVDEFHAPVAEEPRRFSLEDTQMIQARVDKFLDPVIIRPSKSS